MSQAIIITAYKDEPMLIRIIDHFLKGDESCDFRVFVHIDKKSQVLNVDRINALGYARLEATSKYAITWGSVNHVYAVLDMMKLALACSDVDYVHVVSGQDLPLHPREWFVKEFSKNKNCYISDVGLVASRRKHTAVRYTRYWCPSRWNPRNKIVARLNDILFKMQQILGIVRKRIGDNALIDVMFSMIWASYSIAAVRDIVEFAENNERFMRGLNFVQVPEEVFFATALHLNSKVNIIANDRRFYEWTREMPAILKGEDYDKIFSKDYAFARKVDSKHSIELIEKVYLKIKDVYGKEGF